MTQLIFGQSALLYGYVAGALVLAFGLVRLGHRVIDLLRDWRNFRDGK